MGAPMKTVLRIALLSLICVSLLTQNSVTRTLASDQNSILNLYDAFGYQKRGTVLDWGFSALVRYNGKTLGVDLNQVDIAVLSHRHFDHISGFDYMLKVKPAVKAYLPADTALGAPFHL